MVNKVKGFTLIEVVLVLAVGSLIFGMAFIAYGQASANRRDSQRRADLGKIAGELENYAADNNGNYPYSVGFVGGTFENNFIPEYVENLKDPGGASYFSINSNEVGGISYFPKKWGAEYDPAKFCDNSTNLPSGTKDYVIKMKLEKGETCRDSRQ